MSANLYDAMIVVTDSKLWLACQGIAFWSPGFLTFLTLSWCLSWLPSN